mmetsp:Transcript_142239/g.361182  ORF Transcript_142239/g.361182 Transcript_142239/m.361182 type:complete len:106 (+) Transcript_142239:151-468(+)
MTGGTPPENASTPRMTGAAAEEAAAVFEGLGEKARRCEVMAPRRPPPVPPPGESDAEDTSEPKRLPLSDNCPSGADAAEVPRPALREDFELFVFGGRHVSDMPMK